MSHQEFMDQAHAEAMKGLAEGGLPIGAVLIENGKVVARGHNKRIQDGNPVAHGEMDCLTNAGRRASYRNTVMYTTLSPCMMCSGTIIQFKIPEVVIGEAENFDGNIAFLENNGVKVTLMNDPNCIKMMKEFIEENPTLWNEDIAED
ncbi:MAG: nucleoside deaminase [Proteobacteria bacterium]|nr:nucleoside deaminase [Pseudomonadota bacterium]